MTYKAGDKVWLLGRIDTIKSVNGWGFISELGISCTASELTPATPVEIAKQAVLDEVSNRMDSASPILSNLLDQLISEVRISALTDCELYLKTYSSEPSCNDVTPPIIGDETKIS